MTECGWTELERTELLLGASSGSVAEHAAAHLKECEGCSSAFAEQVALWGKMDAWTLPEVSSDFNRGLYAKVDASQQERWYDRWARDLKAFFAQPSLALASAALVVVAGFMLDHAAVDGTRVSRPSEVGAIHAPAVQLSPSDAEQMEKTLDDMEMLRQFDLTSEEKETTSKSM